jgi:hypothetical protein
VQSTKEEEPTMRLHLATVSVAAFLMLLLASPAEAKKRPTVDSPNGDTCFADPTTDRNCNNGGEGAICYCCYDDGCWICGVNPLPGNECVWDDAYRAQLAPPPATGPMSIAPETGARATQDALIDLLAKKNVVTRKELLGEVMSSRRARAERVLENGRLKESVATQKRINRYFHAAVVPKLKGCWDRIRGKGTIEVRYQYADDGKGVWAFKALKVTHSTVPQGQDEVALDCMQKAAAGTSFPKEKTDPGRSYAVNWAWPVPLPPDAPQQVERMMRDNGGGGTGCDGHGAPARCVTCSGTPLSCVAVCVGGDPPCTLTENPLPGGFSRTCTVGSGCASGGGFGVVGGGVVMY